MNIETIVETETVETIVNRLTVLHYMTCQIMSISLHQNAQNGKVFTFRLVALQSFIPFLKAGAAHAPHHAGPDVMIVATGTSWICNWSNMGHFHCS